MCDSEAPDNLLKEAEEELARNGKTLSQIRRILVMDHIVDPNGPCEVSYEDFIKAADVEYSSGTGR